MTFSKWIEFEARRIADMSEALPEQHRSDYIVVQVEAALHKAFAHGKDGLSVDADPRAF